MRVLDAIGLFLLNHCGAVLGAGTYLLGNAMPRPYGDDGPRWQRVVWSVVDRLAVLTHESFPGSLKMFGRRSPASGPQDVVPGDGSAQNGAEEKLQ